ncbi:D-alanyl-D-alanine carboxypeptidase family protein [Suttonella sp. R2A3]|uniref:M15 family metallopeptidase n=1 Tax=Suttonella sp. R2A3 TaxID=2908648 RepID=UPI001F2C579E|nr:M15 family metallopeptidase [Suttonella sp. R2A3]UJF24524.1 D-alanyl-D-alanine carboxypeptidase family protein [Suttonella sp. R2A3]
MSQTLSIPPFIDPDWAKVHSIPIYDDGSRLERIPEKAYWLIEPVYAYYEIEGAIGQCYLRPSVIERLERAARTIERAGLLMQILDGWRPPRVQQALYQSLYDSYQQQYPDEGEAQWHKRTQYFVSLPSEQLHKPSPHLTGGSVDVTLCSAEGEPLDMGSEFDEASERSYSDAYEHQAGDIRKRRRLLYQAMIEAGFTNLSSEWWHYDYGNQSWAYHRGETNAHYGLIYLD